MACFLNEEGYVDRPMIIFSKRRLVIPKLLSGVGDSGWVHSKASISGAPPVEAGGRPYGSR